MNARFSWPALPQTQIEFEALMQAIDSALTSEALKPAQRPLRVSRLLWEAFGWAGNALPVRALALKEGFTGDVLLAKAFRWYDEVYADRLNGDFALGYIPVRVGNATWRVSFDLSYGRVRFFVDRNLDNEGVRMRVGGEPASVNILCAIEKFPQGLADRLSEADLRSYHELYFRAFEALQWRQELPRTDLLNMARGDFDASTEDVLGGRYGQARWGAQQAAEKTIKGLLTIGGTPFPTGADGHKLLKLGDLLNKHHGIVVPVDILTRASCSAKVRYAEEPSTEEQALVANYAFLRILGELRTSPHSSTLLARA